MRIICPNCDAQYEVPADIIPEEGRDVQCSNCGQTWYQDGAAADEAAPLDSEESPPEPQSELDEPADDEEYIETPPPAPEPPKVEEPAEQPTRPEPKRNEIDPTVADILRQEGEREAAARAADVDTGAFEIQTDLGFSDAEDEGSKRAREAQDHMAKIRGEANEPAAAPRAPRNATRGNVGEAAASAAALGSRRELLPDIEEINSTLRSTGDRAVAGNDPDPEAPIRARKKRGFRRGFSIALLLFAIAVLVYVFAPQIASAVPQADPFLTSYVTWVDGLRSGLDTQLQGILRWLDRAAASSSGS